MQTLVMKFGGTSVGSTEALAQATKIICSQQKQVDRLVVVVSAMSGVTNNLIQCALNAAASKDYQSGVELIRQKHVVVLEQMLDNKTAFQEVSRHLDQRVQELESFCGSIQILGEITPRAMDVISSIGERINAQIVAALIRQSGHAACAVDAGACIITDDRFQDAVPLIEETNKRVKSTLIPLLEEGEIPVVTGFIGATLEGIPTTLGRGGSDYTAAILGRALAADEVWTWTDVDGVMSADPGIVPDAEVIPLLSTSEVGELAYFGAKVLHPKTVRPLVSNGIPLWVKNTFNPQCPGTCIMDECKSVQAGIKAITLIDGLSMITVAGRGMLGVPGIAARTFGAVAQCGASVLMISQASSEQSITFVIPYQAVSEVVAALEREMVLEIERRDIDHIGSMDDIVIITAVGAGLRSTPGIAAGVFNALSVAKINVIAIAQGSSECSFSLVVAESDGKKAVRSIHAEVVDHD